MRVIAGNFKRSNLYTLDGDATRPTKDMVKEAFFSSISINNETVFLDLFSGSGAIGIEALSRGAKECVFNDSNREAVKIIEKNLDKFNCKQRVLNLDYKECISKLKNTVFNYIYIDPPYVFNDYETLFNLIEINNITDNNSLIVIEVKKTTDLNNDYNGFELIKEKKYGITKLLYFRKRG